MIHRLVCTFVFIMVSFIAFAQDDILAQYDAEPNRFFNSAEITDPDALKWRARVLTVFADTPFDPQFNRQIELLKRNLAPLAERGVLLVTDTDSKTPSALRRALRPHGFGLVLLDKDGRVMLRKPAPWDVREIINAIDKTPTRQQELQSER